MELLDNLVLEDTIEDPELPEPVRIFRENRFDVCEIMTARIPEVNPEAYGKLIKKSVKYNSHISRVNSVYSLVETEMRILFENLTLIGKNTPVSTKFQISGDSQFVNENFKMALQLYNRSISFAEPGSEQLGRGYAKRSAILYQHTFFRECLNDIELAMASNVPDSLKPILLERKEKSLEYLEKNPITDDYEYHDPLPEVSGEEAHAGAYSYQKINRNIKLCYDENRGGYFVATKDIQPGEFIYIEKSYVLYLLPHLVDKHCSHCSERSLNLIPCKKCSKFMYCSEQCREEAFEEYHQFECSIYDNCRGGFLDDIYVLILRCLFKGRDEYKDVHIDQFAMGIQESDIEEMSFRNNKFSDVYRMNQRMSTIEDRCLLKYSISVATIFYLVKHHSNFFEQFNPDQNMENKFKKYAFHLAVSFERTLSVLKKFAVNGPETVASAVGILQDFAYHACAENTVAVCYGPYAVARAKKVIKAGQQCTVNYPDEDGISLTYGERPKIHRQLVLLEKFRYSCHCMACENDWPLKKSLPLIMSQSLPLSQLAGINQAIMTGNAKKVREEIIPKLLAAIMELNSQEPNRVLYEAESFLRMAYVVLANRDFFAL